MCGVQGIFLALACVMWMYQMYCFFRRRQNNQLDWEALAVGVFEAAGCVGAMFWTQCTLISIYWFVFYKAQDAVFIITPENNRVRPQMCV